MHGTTKQRGSSRWVLPVLLTALAGTVAFGAWTVLQAQEVEQDLEIASIRTQTRVRTQAAKLRTAHGGRLVLEPATQEEVRQVVTFCDLATRADIAALREAALTAQDPLVAGNAVRALGRLRVVARDPQLAALVHDPRSRVRDETIIALGECGDRAASDTLATLAADPDPKVRVLALRSLGRLGGERAEEVARGVLAGTDASREERAFARAALQAKPGR